MEEVQNTTSVTTTAKAAKSKEITMTAFSEMAMKVYPVVPSVINVSMMEKVREIILR